MYRFSSLLKLLLISSFVLSVHSKTEKKRYKNESKLKFIAGRIPPGSFEYNQLNGFYTPKKAVQVCESDPACAGFTFKGTSNLPKLKYEVYFFHFVPFHIFEETSSSPVQQYYHWTSYVVQKRTFSRLENFKIIQNSETANRGTCITNRYIFFKKISFTVKLGYNKQLGTGHFCSLFCKMMFTQ